MIINGHNVRTAKSIIINKSHYYAKQLPAKATNAMQFHRTWCEAPKNLVINDFYTSNAFDNRIRQA